MDKKTENFVGTRFIPVKGRTIDLSASADSGAGSGQHIARITGRSRKYQFERAYIGHKCGRSTTHATVGPGLYKIRDVNKGKKAWRYRVILSIGDGLEMRRASQKEALAIARALGAGRPIDEIVYFGGGDKLEILSVGDRVEFIEEIDAGPYFVIPEGGFGTVVDQLDLMAGGICVRLDKPVQGLEENTYRYCSDMGPCPFVRVEVKS